MKTNPGIEDLRRHLFNTIEGLLDKTNPLDIARANAVANVASKIVDSAKAETEHLKLVSGGTGSGFIPEEPRALPAPDLPRLTAVEGSGEFERPTPHVRSM